ncbi:MAG TPA: spore coat U domain-containing protein [Rhizomicrobium sp.]|jgi:spore coat protein U-like protein|nr:spore coat U domain-containing protein [Rhizomicrobium sp.]
MHGLKHPFRSPACQIGILTLALMAGSATADATTATGTFAVTATVLSGCAVVATDLIFGNYTSTSGTPLDATSTVVATCTSGVAYTVAADAGTGTSATEAARSMTGLIGGGALNYLLYTNSGHSTLWGDGTLSTTTFGGTAGLLPTTYTVYGRIPISQHPAAGLYADLVTVTLTY